MGLINKWVDGMSININPYLCAKKKKKKPKQYVYAGKGLMYWINHFRTFEYKPLTWERLTNLFT